MNRIIEYNITSEYNGYNSEEYLRNLGYSSKLMRSIKLAENGIMVNGAFQFANIKLCEGDHLRVYIPEDASSDFKPVSYSLDIAYEDEDLIIVNKPANMPIHPSMGNYENTLGNAIVDYFKDRPDGFVFRCINRLDRDTSGLTIIAKNPLSGVLLSSMQKERKIKRTYQAIVRGIITKEGTIDAPIARENDSVIKRCVSGNGDLAITHYSPIKTKGNLSLIELKLETGRTHQIRVHMKHIGYPLIGDFLYNPDDLELINRQALHSYKLEFTHPITDKELTITAPLPKDMANIIY